MSMGILQARILEWIAMLSSRGSSQPRDQTQVSSNVGGFFTVLSELQGKPIFFIVGFKSLVVSKAPPILPPAHDEALDHLQCYGWRGNEGRGGAVITIVFSQQRPRAPSTLNTGPLKSGTPDCPQSPLE